MNFGPNLGSVEALFALAGGKFLKLLRMGLVGGAVVGLVQPAFALGFDIQPPAQAIALSAGQSVYDALQELDKSSGKPANTQQSEETFSALADFAKGVAQDPRPGSRNPSRSAADEQAVVRELRDFANSVGAKRPDSNPARVKLAEADNAVDALKEFLSKSSAPADAPKAAPAPAPAPAAKPSRPVADAHFVGDKTCMTCHASHAESFSKTLMGRLWRNPTNSQGYRGKFACENCHGAGSEHVKLGGGRGVGGIISFRSNDPAHSVQEINSICLTCHERGDRTYWSGSTHEVRNVACTDCHTIMRAVSEKFQLKTINEPETCFQCHKDRRAQMMRSAHMPLREGKVVCTSCHQPHGTANEALLRTPTINDTCYKCHAEKRGPFLFEHTPVRENCLNCHDPHGSINEYMLKISRPRLCTECHGFGHGPSNSFNSYQIIGRACNNCHTQVHGTNSPSGALLHR